MPKPIIDASRKPAAVDVDVDDLSDRITIPSGGAGDGDDAAEAPTSAELRAIDAMHARIEGTFYEVLGVQPDVAVAVIQAAHLDLVQRYHPNLFKGRVTSQYMFQVEAIFRAITAAVSTLADATRRAAYDTTVARQQEQEAWGDAVERGGKASGIKRRSPVRPSTATPVAMPAPSATFASDGVERTTLPWDISSPDVKPVAAAVEAPDVRPVAFAVEALDVKPVAPVVEARRVVVTDDLRPAAARPKVSRARDPRAEEAHAAPPTSRHVTAAGHHERAGRWGAAVAAWKAACAENPKDLHAHLGLVNAACEGLVELDTAGDYARIAMRIAPKSADAVAGLARVLLLQGSVTSARKAVTNALALDAEHPLALNLARRLKG